MRIERAGASDIAAKPDMVSDPLTDRLLGCGHSIRGEWPMQIVCPNCETSYQLDASAVGPTGRSVRCARCRTVWFAANTAALAEIAASHRAEMAQFATAESGPGGTESWPPSDEPARGSGTAAEEAAPGPDPADIGFVHDAPPIATTGDTMAADPSAAPPVVPDGPLIESPALAPIAQGPAADDPVHGEDIETVAARRAAEQASNWPFRLQSPGLPTAILALVLFDLGLIGWRAEIVRIAPQTASLYAAIGLGVNLRGLVLADVTTETQTKDGAQVLLVQGQIVSTTKRTVEVPRLRFAARNGGGNEIYSWTALPNRSLLGPGETLSFQSRLASPPPETYDVLVRFFNRHDLGVGIQ
jgi:predicted Zn finger-like uncharacterized protein